ncbi:helix-turn-helix domain-containing protein [Melghirimyces algeriensis]|uniref:Helix-turn-helix n=1 Tax=Melghirimyces algeriensis TaxID=910412 RepID=A0A521AQ73_9BACL|nr:helix-turn-helix domain-containing protein [Melghirimyces algeriensis]SMO36916.1 Helix-turn-helix [Melghirimyces algeriensis]
MESFDPISVGEIIRKVRKEKGLRLEDLADEHISTATISNVERGMSQVRLEKTHYILEKLGISAEELPKHILRQQKAQNHVQFVLDIAESLSKMGQADKSFRILKGINLTDDHPCVPTFHWLLGSYYLSKSKFKKAEQCFHNAIRISTKGEFSEKTNIGAHSFKDLGRCSYYQNELQQAIVYTDSGLGAYNPEGERRYVKYILLRNKAIYLERLGRTIEALKIVQDVWDEIDQIQHSETVLSFYWLKAELMRKSSAFQDAIQTAQEGLRIASLNNIQDSSVDLWVTLAGSYSALKDWEKAEICFEIAMDLSEEKDNRYIRSCIQLAELYKKKGEWGKSEENLIKAIYKAEKYNCSFYLADALLSMGELHLSRGRKVEAVDQLREAIDLAEYYGYADKEYKAWYKLAQAYENINQKEFETCTRNMYRVQRKINERWKRNEISWSVI